MNTTSMLTPQETSSSSKSERLPLIYIVDDEPMVLELTALILDPQAYRIEKFRDPETALEQFRTAETKPDLIVTDFAMPTIHGLALMEACRRIKPGQKVLLMSGTVEEDVFKDRSDQPDAFVAKPFHVEEFADIVRKLIS